MEYLVTIQLKFGPDDHVGADKNSVESITHSVMKQLEWHGSVRDSKIIVEEVK